MRADCLERRRHADDFLAMLKKENIPRVPGAAVFLTRAEDDIPALMVDYVRRIGSLHQSVVLLTVSFDDAPRVGTRRRSRVDPLGDELRPTPSPARGEGSCRK